MRLAPEPHYGELRGLDAIQASRISHVLAKPPMLLAREPRANLSRAEREAASQRRKALNP